jgi:hypothetical protein
VFATFSSVATFVVTIRSYRRRDASSSLPSITQDLILYKINSVLSSTLLLLLAGSLLRFSVRE